MKVTISRAHVRVYRAVEGAVRNTAHGHPRWKLSNDMARSIAKRATGTLTADWPDVLAAISTPSELPEDSVGNALWPPPSRARLGKAGRGTHRNMGSPQLADLWLKVARMAGDARRGGQKERKEALIDVLRLIYGQKPCR